MFEIENNVPLPPLRYGNNHSKYPWREMKVGDSFHVPPRRPDQSAAQVQAAMAATASGAGKRLKARYTVRQEGDGVRIWRVE